MTEDDLAAIELINSEIRAALKEQWEPLNAADMSKALADRVAAKYPTEFALFAFELVDRHIYELVHNAMTNAAAQARREARDAPKRAFADALNAAAEGDTAPLRRFVEESRSGSTDRLKARVARDRRRSDRQSRLD